MTSFEHHIRTRLVFGPGTLHQVGTFAAGLGFRRTLIVADAAMDQAGHLKNVLFSLAGQGIESTPWSSFDANPDSRMVAHGKDFAAQLDIDSIVALGGGSSLDCAKAINILLTNGGAIQDYWGHNKVPNSMLPMIGIPATSGTGSEAQTYALISDAATHTKMAIGDDKAAFAVAILDPEVARTQPFPVRAAAGYDALSHAVESLVTTKRNGISDCFSREAWRLMHASFETVLHNPDDVEALGRMQLGAWFAGCAIEASMLGATHACANPLTAVYGIPHGQAIAVMLPHVVRWNAQPEYTAFHPDLPARLTGLAGAARLKTSLAQLGVESQRLPELAAMAAQQWTGRFNPRPFAAEAALELYQCAF